MALTTPPGYGLEEVIGLGLEATWGTAATITDWIRPNSCSIMGREQPQTLSGPSGAIVPYRRFSQTKARYRRPAIDVSGDLVWELDYDEIGHFLGIALPSLTLDTAGSSGLYTHVFSSGTGIPTSNSGSLTIKRQGGTVYDTGSNVAMLFTGCVLDSLEISGAADRIVTATARFVGKNFAPTTTASATMTSAPYVEFHDSVVRCDTTVETAPDASDELTGPYSAIDWTFKLERGLRVIPATGTRTAGVPSRVIRQPIPQGYYKPTMRFSKDWYDEFILGSISHYNARHPGETNHGDSFRAFSINCASNEIAANSIAYSIDMWFPAGIVTSPLPEYPGGPDILTDTIEVEAGFAGSVAPCIVTVKNATAAATSTTYGAAS